MDRENVRYMLIGVDGQPWMFGEADCPLRVVTDPDIGGAGFKVNRLSNVKQYGASFNSVSHEIKEFGLEVHLKGMGLKGNAALDVWKRWRKSLGNGEQELIFYAMRGNPGAERYRVSGVRLNGPMPKVELDRIRTSGYFRETAPLASEHSLWQGDPLGQTWLASGFGSAQLTYLGDVEAPLVYEVTGPITNLKLGVGGEQVELTGTTIPAGQTWKIDTNPQGQTIRRLSDDVNMKPTVYQNAGAPRSWHKLIQPNVTGPQSITIAGTGTSGATAVAVSCQTFYDNGVPQ
jgi:hypothetical protein